MSDPKKPSDSSDLRARLGLGSSAPPSGKPNVPAPAFGASPLPPPAVAPLGKSPVVPPPAVGGGVPAPVFGAKPQLDVAPPPFLAKKKKKVRRIVQEEYEDVDPIEDPKARARMRLMIIICVIIAVPVMGVSFYVGKSRQDWALHSRSAGDAATLAEKLTKATPVLEEVQAKTAAAYSKAQSKEIDEGYVEYARDVSERRPLASADLDMVNYAAFEPEVVDQLFAHTRLLERLWGEMTSHRNLTKRDLAALQSATKMGTPHNQVRFGVVLMSLDAETFGGSVGVVGNPGVNDEGVATLDVQVRPGRPAHALKVWTEGPFGDTPADWVIPLDPAQTAPEGGALAKSEQSHWVRYMERLEELRELSGRAVKLNADLLRQVQAVAN